MSQSEKCTHEVHVLLLRTSVAPRSHSHFIIFVFSHQLSKISSSNKTTFRASRNEIAWITAPHMTLRIRSRRRVVGGARRCGSTMTLRGSGARPPRAARDR